jgi:hypothetical protein
MAFLFLVSLLVIAAVATNSPPNPPKPPRIQPKDMDPLLVQSSVGVFDAEALDFADKISVVVGDGNPNSPDSMTTTSPPPNPKAAARLFTVFADVRDLNLPVKDGDDSAVVIVDKHYSPLLHTAVRFVRLGAVCEVGRDGCELV